MIREQPARSGTDPAGTPPGLKPLDWAQATGNAGPVLRAVACHVRRQQRRRRATLAGVAGVAALLVAGAWFWRSPTAARVNPIGDTRAALVREAARQILPDGSVVDLHSDAVVTVQFDPALRRVVLQRGEAHFSVSRDPARPFLVEVAGLGVRALGTAFSVRLAAQALDVVVTEGQVAVAETAVLTAAEVPAVAGAGETAPVLVGAGQRVVVDVVTRVLPTAAAAVSGDDLKARLAWRVPRFEFTATPLVEVVALFNQHSASNHSAPIVLAEPALGRLPLSGVLRADNVDVLRQILEKSYGVRTRRGPAGEIVLFRRE